MTISSRPVHGQGHSEFSYRKTGIECPCCHRKGKASVFRRPRNRYPIMCCRRKGCSLSHDREQQKREGRMYADSHPHETGIVGQVSNHRFKARKSRAERLAGQAHHNPDVRSKKAKGLIRWFLKKADGATDEEVLRFLEFFRDFETPTMKMDELFSEAAELIKSGQIDKIIGRGWRHREIVVAALAYTMSLYRGASARISFSGRMFAKYFSIEDLQLSHTTVNKAINDLIGAGILKTIHPHEIIMRAGGMLFRSRVFRWLGSRPFDDLDEKITQLKVELQAKLSQPQIEPSTALVLPRIHLESSVPAAESLHANNATTVIAPVILDCTLSMAMQGKSDQETEKVEPHKESIRDRYGGNYWDEGH